MNNGILSKNTIPLVKPHFDKEEILMLEKTLESGWIAQGPMCLDLENKIKDYLKTPYAITTSNCTASLYIALRALNIGCGDEVIVSDFSYPATGIAVMQTGATPRFADVYINTYNIKRKSTIGLINDSTRAIIPVHTFGNPCNMGDIIEISKKYEIPIIEDAACALGSSYGNKKIGTIGKIGCFSLHARKGITTGEGGIIVTSDKNIYDFMRKYSSFGVEQTFGRKRIPTFNHEGFNFKMSDVNAAIGIAQLKKIDTIIDRKREIAKLYDDLIGDIELISPQRESAGGKHIYQSFVMYVFGNTRDNLIQFLQKNGIESTIGTYAQHAQPIFKTHDNCEISEELFKHTISIPIYYSMKDEQVHYISDKIHDFFEVSCH
jgi:dTDP-4-amino-4,6-dideoxygalactose transaminase